MKTIRYGAASDQAGDLYPPSREGAPLVCFFHGGFWRTRYGRDQIDPIATDLCAAGIAVWNVGYRRVGPHGHPWPATLDDVAAAMAYLPQIHEAHREIDSTKLLLVGHSAGGHLAFYAAMQAQRQIPALPVRAAIGLAPVLDLQAASSARLGNGAVDDFIGGSPAQVPERYRLASPAAHLPLGVRQYILHGELDPDVPVRFSRAYAAAAHTAGDFVSYTELAGTGHMEFIDPTTTAYRLLRAILVSAM